MKTIGDLLTRDLTRKIEEITQVDQADEESVYSEITEYVATDSIRDHYATLLRAIAEAPAEPHEGVGVWISGLLRLGQKLVRQEPRLRPPEPAGARPRLRRAVQGPDRGPAGRRPPGPDQREGADESSSST